MLNIIMKEIMTLVSTSHANDHINTQKLIMICRYNFRCSNKLQKALRKRRYLRQGKAIRQVASPSSFCQRFPYAPFSAMVTKISK